MGSREVKVRITEEDRAELSRYYCQKNRPVGSRSFTYTLLIISIPGVGSIAVLALMNNVPPGSIVLIVFGLFAVILFYVLMPFIVSQLAFRIRLLWAKLARNQKFDQCTYTLTEEAIHGLSAYGSARMSWDDISSVEVTEKYIFIQSDAYGIHMIPLRDFPSPEDANSFISFLKESWQAAQARHQQSPPR